MESGRISISEIRDRYDIEQSTAYKWRTALRNLGLEEEWSHYDRINSREINLAEALKKKPLQTQGESAIAVVETPVLAETATSPPQSNESTCGEKALHGISPERLAEINSTVEIEVIVEDALYEYHKKMRRAERAQRAAQAVKEVSALDPKIIVEIAMTQIAQIQSGIVA